MKVCEQNPLFDGMAWSKEDLFDLSEQAKTTKR